jgi:tRNA 2-selenouridine synthase
LNLPFATVAQRREFDDVIDVRSPAEFAEDHVPGAINCPVLDDAERALIGTMYTQVSAFEARKVGAALVARNIAAHLEGQLAQKPKRWRPLVYCWRGGQRSEAFATWLKMIGWDAHRVAGGYKTWRHHVIEQLQTLPGQLELTIVAGATGSAKTRLLHALAAQGAQVLDLEAIAAHKGSVLGALPNRPQPAQKGFDTALYDCLERFDRSKPVFVEAESRRIGRIFLPLALTDRMHASACLLVESSVEARIDFLLRDYAYLADDLPGLQSSLASLIGLQSKETIARWQELAAQGSWRELFTALVVEHYDPLYRRSQRNHFERYAQARRVVIDSLDSISLSTAAKAVLADID